MTKEPAKRQVPSPPTHQERRALPRFRNTNHVFCRNQRRKKKKIPNTVNQQPPRPSKRYPTPFRSTRLCSSGHLNHTLPLIL